MTFSVTARAKPIVALCLACLVLAGCASRFNPFNWFGGSREVASSSEAVNPLIPERSGISRPEEVYAGELIAQITDLRIERTRSGGIVLAEGLAARQGPFAVQLTPATEDDTPVDGVLTYSFDIVYPEYQTRVGPERTRRVTAARSLSNETLAGVSVIRVLGAQNAREVRR